MSDDLERFDAGVLDPDPEDAVKALRGALGVVGLVLPDLAVDCCFERGTDGRHGPGCRGTGAPVPAVELGRAQADVVLRLAELVLRAAAAGEVRPEPYAAGPPDGAGGPVAADGTAVAPVSRSVLRFVDLTIAPDREPGAEPVAHAMRCSVCSRQSRVSRDSGPLLDWALVHAGRNPGHRAFREVITRPYRVRPAEAQRPG